MISGATFISYDVVVKTYNYTVKYDGYGNDDIGDCDVVDDDNDDEESRGKCAGINKEVIMKMTMIFMSFIVYLCQHQKAFQCKTMMRRILGENARGSTREMRGGIERQPRHSFQNSFRPPLAAAL